MVTVCELRIALKNKGIKGYSGLKKDELMKMLDSGKKPETKKQEVKKEPVKKKEEEPVKKKEPAKKQNQETPKFGNKPIEELYKNIESLKKQIKDGANKIESARSVKFLDIYKTAYDFAIKKMKEDIKPKGKKTLKSMINKITSETQFTKTKQGKEVPFSFVQFFCRGLV